MKTRSNNGKLYSKRRKNKIYIRKVRQSHDSNPYRRKKNYSTTSSNADNDNSNESYINGDNNDFYDDFNGHDEIELEENNAIPPIIDPLQPNRFYLEFQRKLYLDYENSHYIRINKLKNINAKPKLDDTLAIYEFSLNHDLSNKGIDDLINLMKQLQNSNNVFIPLPNTAKTLNNQV